MDESIKISVLNDIRKHLREEDREQFSYLEGLIENNQSKAMLELGDLCLDNHFSRTNHIEQAVSLYQLAIKYGNTEAMNRYGVLCFNTGEYETACEMFHLAVRQEKNSTALTNLAKMYYQGLGVKKEYNQAFCLFHQAAELGDNEAMFWLGKCYYQGLGVEKDRIKEIEWYKKAAESGNTEASLHLGLLYKRGMGVEKNKAQAKRWYEKAVNQYEREALVGSIEATNQIAMIYYKHLKDNKVAINWYLKARELGDEEADYFIAEIYDEQLNNLSSAIEWYGKSAKLGNSDAALRLALIYEEDKKDERNSIKWFEKAYQLGSVEALEFLGDAYKNQSNFDKAKECYEELMHLENHQEKGILALGNLHEESAKYEESKRYYEKLAQRGNKEGLLALGDMYANGKGLKKDYHLAIKYYEKAIKAGDYSIAESRIRNVKILNTITDNEGIIQTDLYKQFLPEEKEWIMTDLRELDRKNKVIRVKSGSTYKLFLK
ncbi:MAG: SEL1-like repeat protein [Carnobacterium sp.]|nr:SEL1-like repeat protein [Carnobacterium sp.]